MSLLLKNISAVVTCDCSDSISENVDILCEDGKISAVGRNIGYHADRVIDCSDMLCYPGLVNTHHHFYQLFSRNLPHVQGMELFDWLRALYRIWRRLDCEAVRLSSECALGLLMKSGCTTAFDHHYVFPGESSIDFLEAQFAAAQEVGARMYASRGSMDLSEKDGGLPPDCVVQTADKILKDSMEAVERFHDPSEGSMRMVALAPCSPFSASSALYRESAALARSLGVRLHTHLCETKDEEDYTLSAFGCRPLDYMRSLGFIGSDVWYAHGIWFNDEELELLRSTGTAIAHCPVSNMKLSSGAARIADMLRMGITVSLGVDGSASNDGSDMLAEMRAGYLLSRVVCGEKAPTAYDFLKTATVGGAKALGRDDIGSIETGKRADMFLVSKRRLEILGADLSPATLPAAVGIPGVDYTVVNGKVTVENGMLCGVDEDILFERSRRKIKEYLSEI